MAEERLGASFSIDVTQLKAGLKTANKLIRESQSEFNKAAAGLDNWQKSEAGLNAKIKSLNSIIGVQEQKVSALKKQYQKLVDDGLDEASDRAIELRTQINKEEAALESNKAELKKQTDALEDLENQSDETGDELEQVGKKAEKSSGGFTVLKGALADLAADGFRYATQKAKEFVTEMVNVGKTFDDSMAGVAAVSGATGDDLEKLREKAKEMGSSTKFTASEAADAFNYMAMAGWKTEEMLGGIEGILSLAAASGTDLATTSDIVTDALTAMGYEAKDAGRLANVMAAASSNANTNVEMMGQTFQYAAPVVGALGYNMEDTAVAIGLMANAGIKGEKAGTALRSIMSRLAAPPKECATAMEELGISITDNDGKMKSLNEVIGDMRTAFSNLDEQEAAANAKHIAGQEAMSGLLAIVNAAPSDFEKLTKAVEESEGAAQSMSDTMLDTLGGDMTVLNSQIEGVRLTIYEQFEPTLRDAVKKVQKWLGQVDWKAFGKKASDALKKVIDYGKRLGKQILPTLKKAFKVVVDVVKFAIKHFKTLVTVLGTALVVFKAIKAALAIKAAITAVTTAVAGLTAGVGLATKAQTVWNAAMASNPIGAVATAVGLLAGGIALLVGHNKAAKDSTESLTKKQKAQIEEIDKLTEYVNESTEAYKNLQEEQQKQISGKEKEFNYYDDLWEELQSIVDQNGKVKEGYEGRAEFIATQLSEAFDIEVGLVDGVIQKYEELQTTVEETMRKKRAEIYLSSQEEMYANAIQNIDEATAKYQEAINAYDEAVAEKARVDEEQFKKYQELKHIIDVGQAGGKWYKEVSEEYRKLTDQSDLLGQKIPALKTDYLALSKEIEGYQYDIGVYEHNMALAHEGNYEDMIKATYDYVSEYGDAVDAEKALLEQNVNNTRTQLEILRGVRNESNAAIYDDQIKSAEKLLVEQLRELQAYNSATEEHTGENFTIWRTMLEENLSAIIGKNLEFKGAGQGLVQMFVDGEKIGSPMATTEMDAMVNSMLDELDSGTKDAETAGEDFVEAVISKVSEAKTSAETAGKDLIEGVNTGIKNRDKQNSAFSSISLFGNSLLNRFRNSLEEKSPSKATRKMGGFLVEGIELGIKDKEKSAFKTVSKFGQNVLSRFKDYDFGGLSSAVGDGITAHNQSVQGIGNKSVTVNQVNNYSQAHSRYEIYKSKQQTAAAVRLALGTV